jgi:hypothetical protein
MYWELDIVQVYLAIGNTLIRQHKDAFAERATGKVVAMCFGLMEDSRVVRKGSGTL